jgi:hypothetical protein
MAWKMTEIVVSGEAVNGGINSRDDSVMIEIPFTKKVSVGDKVTADGNEYEVTGSTDVGNRSETLMLEVKNDKPVSRRTANKARG